MERILNQSHDKHTFIYACSRLFERTAFYGLRSLIVLYMVGESLKMSNEDALMIYGWFTASILFSQILGGLFGDLIIGNKKAIILGGVLQAIGAFSLCIPSITGLYIGLVLVVLGGGLYTPNMISHFGKLYVSKTKLLDSAFTIFYLFVNIGALIGTVAIGYFGDKFGWSIGFIVAGLLMLLSISFLLMSKEPVNGQMKQEDISTNQRVIKILVACMLVGLFWTSYEIANIRIFDLQMKFAESSNSTILKGIWPAVNSGFFISASFVAIILWSFFYNNRLIRLTIGFFLGAVSFGLLFFIPEIPTDQYVILYLASILLLNISEIHIAPVILSIITQYANPKYLAIIISLSFIPTKLSASIVGLFYNVLYKTPSLALELGMTAMIIINVGLTIYIVTKIPAAMVKKP